MKDYCITPEKTLLQCMQVLDRAGAGIALVVDETFRLLGTVSDGDIRRALINGCGLECPVSLFIRKDCYRVSPEVSRSEVLDMMQARWIEQVPIVDHEGKVVGLHLLHELLGAAKRPNWAVIMAGGEGRRLRPLTEKMPKPMIKVAGRPILERVILLLVSYGIQQIFLAVNYMAHVIETHFEDGHRFGCNVQYLREKEPLGSGGAVSLLPEVPAHPIVLINGDLIVDVDLSRMLDRHTRNNFYATIGVHPYFHEVPYGCVDEENGKVVRMQEKPVIQKMVNAGVYILSPEAVAKVPSRTFFPITTLIDDALEKELPCGTFTIEKEWIDVGRPKELKRATGSE